MGMHATFCFPQKLAVSHSFFYSFDIQLIGRSNKKHFRFKRPTPIIPINISIETCVICTHFNLSAWRAMQISFYTAEIVRCFRVYFANHSILSIH